MALSVWASHWCERATFVTPALGLGRGDRIGSRVAVDLRRPGPSHAELEPQWDERVDSPRFS